MNNKEILDLISAEKMEIANYSDVVSSNTISFGLEDIAMLGANFFSLISALSAMGQMSSHGKLYSAVIPRGAHLAVAKKGGLLGTLIKDGKGIVGQARFKEVGDLAVKGKEIGQLCTALTLVAINIAVNNIAENQKDIINFLNTDKQTKIKGDLLVLSDILKDYQYNWNNKQFLNNRETQVLDIKRSSEQNILFYKESINNKLTSNKLFNIKSNEVINTVQNQVKYYQLSLYIYSFASFLDVILLSNYDISYLDKIKETILNYYRDYNDFIDGTQANIEKFLQKSWSSSALKGASFVGEFLGHQIERIDDKDNKIRIDDALIGGSKKISDFVDTEIEKTKKLFDSMKAENSNPFVEKINLIEKINNNQLKIYVDNEKVYLNTD